jgi:hypothetical protein
MVNHLCNEIKTKDSAPPPDAAVYQRAAVQAGQECLEAALDYLNRGWAALAVCPPDHAGVGKTHGKKCKHPGKAPWGDWKEFQSRMPTEAELRQKWNDNCQLNVGMTLGGVTPLIGLDVDKESGEQLLQRLANGDLPPTLEFTSGKGRRLLYRMPEGVELRPTPKPGGLQIESGELRMLGLGSQTVMPPSRHPDGLRYAWVPGHGPGEIEPPIAPAWVVDFMRIDCLRAKGERHSHAVGEKISEGHRNSTLTSLAGLMRRKGMSEEGIRAALSVENAARCVPPLDEDEVATIAASVSRYEPAGPDIPILIGGKPINTGCKLGPPTTKRSVNLPEPYQRFPLQALPSVLREYVKQAAVSKGCDPAMVAAPLLAVISAAIGHTRRVRIKADWSEPAIIWTAVVGPSGGGKSPAFQQATAPYFAIEEQYAAQRAVNRDLYEAQKEAWKASKTKTGTPPRPAAEPHALLTDVTIERLFDVLADSPRGILLASEELAGWLSSFTRYRSGGGSDLPHWLSMHNAGSLAPSRKAYGTKLVKHAFVCVTGGIQPGVFSKAMNTPEFLASGLLARLLIVYPPEQRKRWTEAVVKEPVRAAYAALLTALANLRPAADGSPVLLDFAHEAREKFIQFYDAWNGDEVDNTADENERAALWKLEAYSARLALLHHVVSYIQDGKDDTAALISLTSVQAGIDLVRWFGNEVRRAYALIGETSESRDMRHLLALIARKGGGLTPRELHRSHRRKYRSSDEAERVLNELVLKGLAIWADRERDGAGRPAKECRLTEAVRSSVSGAMADGITQEAPADVADGIIHSPAKEAAAGANSVSDSVSHAETELSLKNPVNCGKSDEKANSVNPAQGEENPASPGMQNPLGRRNDGIQEAHENNEKHWENAQELRRATADEMADGMPQAVDSGSDALALALADGITCEAAAAGADLTDGIPSESPPDGTTAGVAEFWLAIGDDPPVRATRAEVQKWIEICPDMVQLIDYAKENPTVDDWLPATAFGFTVE